MNDDMHTFGKTLRWTVTRMLRITRRQWGVATCVAFSVLIAGVFTKLVIWPGYQDPSSRIYTSRLGHARLLRSQGRPFPVTTTTVQQRDVSALFLGEGLMQSEPIQVPVIPMSHIVRVYVEEGDRVTRGQLLAELDDTRARIKIEAAKAAIKTAQAEFARTKIGSAYVLEQERPERDRIRLRESREELAIQEELAQMARALLEQNALSRGEFLEKKLESVQARSRLQQIEWALDVAQAGREHSLAIAEAAIVEAELALAHREHELKDYKVFAPASGVIERCLIHEGEYNQDPGKPAFLIASGVWFTAHVDQTALGQLAVGNSAEVYLEAFPSQTFTGRMVKIHPVVTYNLGGPETNRPIRPLGTGAPEWPATFSVKIELDLSHIELVPGLTGFARISATRRGLAVPRSAVQSVSSQKGLVFVVCGTAYEPREVSLGFMTDGWVEIRAGLSEHETVIIDGHQILEAGDSIEVIDQGASMAAKNTGPGGRG